jgi:N-acyl-D-aspartate/D-glutamate deacylase
MVSFSQSIENVSKVLAHPALMIGSDSIPLYEGEGDRPGKPHPRTYGTFPRVLGEYARERRLFSLETAVHKMTGMAATRIGLRERGIVKPGFFADLTVFDPATVKDESTYAEPHRYPTGIPYVLVNGAVVVDNGRLSTRPDGSDPLPEVAPKNRQSRSVTAPPGRGAWGVWGAMSGPPTF